MDFIAKYLGKISMYMGMLLFLCGLLTVVAILGVLGLAPYSALDILLQAILFVAACTVFNFLAAVLLKVKINPESAVITGLILSAIMGPLSLVGQWHVLIFASLASVVSKYIFITNKKHIFNPAAFGAVASAIIVGYPASWWIGVSRMVPFLLAGGLIVILKIRYYRLLGGFFATYAGLYALYFFFLQKTPFAESILQAGSFALSAPLLFFAFVMLIEPLTAPGTKKKRLYYGVFIATVLFALQNFAPQISYSLGASLLAGNLLTLVLQRSVRQNFVLLHREEVASGAENFWFKPEHAFKFYPGQYLEYTLPHRRPDGRGSRRFFTIASSPTEKNILLTTKFFENGSSFKRRLGKMKEGDKIAAANVAGDFIPPADAAQKIAFIAGGIGATPFRSMVKYFLDKGDSRDVVLIYGVKEEENVAFKDIFDEAHERFGMKNIYTTSRITEELIRKKIPDIKERIFYISGPEPMVRSVGNILSKMGVPSKQVKRDYFSGYE